MAPATTPDPQLVRDGFNLLLVVALLGVIIITALTVLLVLRRNRLARARREPARTRQTPDPWVEAGRRAPTPPDPTPPEQSPPDGAPPLA